MADPKFFKKSNELSLKDIASLVNIKLSNDVDKNKIITDIAPLETADSKKISFLDNKNYIEHFKKSKAGACFFKKDFLNIAPKSMVPLLFGGLRSVPGPPLGIVFSRSFVRCFCVDCF